LKRDGIWRFHSSLERKMKGSDITFYNLFRAVEWVKKVKGFRENEE
jgi:hypothetical protein